MKIAMTAIITASILLSSLSASALIFNHRVKCYGLKECQMNPAKCTKDNHGLFMWKKKHACERALKNQ